jgi:hypothetical protein
MARDSIKLSVYRDLSNRVVGEPDDGPLARRAHKFRGQALHAVLDDPAFRISSWGDTDDEEPHELVEVTAVVVGALKVAAGTAIGMFVAEILKDVAKDTLKAAVVKLVEGLYKRMKGKNRAIQDFYLELNKGVTIHVQPDGAVNLYAPAGFVRVFPKSQG